MPLSTANKLTLAAVTAGALLGVLTWSTLRAVRAARQLAGETAISSLLEQHADSLTRAATAAQSDTPDRALGIQQLANSVGALKSLAASDSMLAGPLVALESSVNRLLSSAANAARDSSRQALAERYDAGLRVSAALQQMRERRASSLSAQRRYAVAAAKQASVATRLTWIAAILLAGAAFFVFRNELSVQRQVEVAHRTHEQQEEELRALSLVDDLTGLNNRRGFLALAEQQIKFARRNSRELVLLFVDMDDFKQINDRHGHQAGDVALQRAARVLRATFRDSDIIARLGGDEFVVLAADTGTSASIVERLRKALVERNQSEAYPYTLSFSVGAARFDPDDPPTIQELLHMADAMLYEQKRARTRTPAVAD
jgi:diguanylate cyclase (GGDEF)-like protein